MGPSAFNCLYVSCPPPANQEEHFEEEEAFALPVSHEVHAFYYPWHVFILVAWQYRTPISCSSDRAAAVQQVRDAGRRREVAALEPQAYCSLAEGAETAGPEHATPANSGHKMYARATGLPSSRSLQLTWALHPVNTCQPLRHHRWRPTTSGEPSRFSLRCPAPASAGASLKIFDGRPHSAGRCRGGLLPAGWAV